MKSCASPAGHDEEIFGRNNRRLRWIQPLPVDSPAIISRCCNRSRAFDTSRALARPDYVYGQLTAQRHTRLPRDFTRSVRGQLQLSSGNLLGSEQMSGGGSASVRGYEEGEASSANARTHLSVQASY